MTGDDFALTAGWGHFGSGDAVMPGQGRVSNGTHPPNAQAMPLFDLSQRPRLLANVPAAVWTYMAATKSSRNGSPTANTPSFARLRPKRIPRADCKLLFDEQIGYKMEVFPSRHGSALWHL